MSRPALGLGAWMRRRRRSVSVPTLEELCDSLQLDGWELLTRPGGAVISTVGEADARRAPWHTVARAIAAWAGPLSLLDTGDTDPERLALLGLSGSVGFTGTVSAAEAPDLLTQGQKILVLTAGDRPSPPAGELAAETGTRVLYAALEATGRKGRQRLAIRAVGAP